MKKILSLFIALLSLASAYAQAGNINVFSAQNVHFYVYLDGKLQHTDPKTNLRILDVPEGSYVIKLEFYNKDIAPVQTHATLHAKKETTFGVMFNEGKETTFNEYSSVPINEVNVAATVPSYVYNREGLAKNANAVVKEETAAFAGQKQTGVLGQADVEARTAGKNNNPEGSNNNDKNTSTATAEPVRENGTTEEVTEVKTYRYKQATDGTTTQVVVCERLITTKTTVYENGMELIGTQDVKKTSTTPYTCLPQGDVIFAKSKESVVAASDKLAEAKKQTQALQCLAPDQLVAFADLLANDKEKQDYAMFAKTFCANPTEYPLESHLPREVAKVEEPKINVPDIPLVPTTTNDISSGTMTPAEVKTKGKKEPKPKKEKKAKN